MLSLLLDGSALLGAFLRTGNNDPALALAGILAGTGGSGRGALGGALAAVDALAFHACRFLGVGQRRHGAGKQGGSCSGQGNLVQ